MLRSQFPPLIIGFVSDLIFQVKIEQAADRLGYQVEWVETAQQFTPDAVSTAWAPSPRLIGEHVEGIDGALIEKLTEWQPALLIFDLGNSNVPWREWVALLKSISATRRIPLICYGAHVDAVTLKAAKSAGADLVVARSHFATNISGLIQKYARTPDYAAFQNACEEPLSTLAIKGLELFNKREYFESHELLEAAWKEDHTPGRELYRAVLQVAVAFLQIERANYNGAIKMFWRVRQWIAPLPDECRGVDLGQLRVDVEQAYRSVLDLGREHIGQFDRSLFRPVRYKS